MSAEKLYSEVFEDFGNAKTKAERITVLQKNDSKSFRTFLVSAFNPAVQFDAPLPMTYRPAVEPAGLNFTYLDAEMTKLYRFIKGHPQRDPNLTDSKKTELVRVILESLHKDEARLMVALLEKKLEVKYLTVNLIKEAFPDISL
jgi:hypothetical protein